MLVDFRLDPETRLCFALHRVTPETRTTWRDICLADQAKTTNHGGSCAFRSMLNENNLYVGVATSDMRFPERLVLANIQIFVGVAFHPEWNFLIHMGIQKRHHSDKRRLSMKLHSTIADMVWSRNPDIRLWMSAPNGPMLDIIERSQCCTLHAVLRGPEPGDCHPEKVERPWLFRIRKDEIVASNDECSRIVDAMLRDRTQSIVNCVARVEGAPPVEYKYVYRYLAEHIQERIIDMNVELNLSGGKSTRRTEKQRRGIAFDAIRSISLELEDAIKTLLAHISREFCSTVPVALDSEHRLWVYGKEVAPQPYIASSIYFNFSGAAVYTSIEDISQGAWGEGGGAYRTSRLP